MKKTGEKIVIYVVLGTQRARIYNSFIWAGNDDRDSLSCDKEIWLLTKEILRAERLTEAV